MSEVAASLMSMEKEEEDERGDVVGDLLTETSLAGGMPSLSEIRDLQKQGVISETDKVTFSSKFVDPSSSDTEDENLDNFNVDSAQEKEVESAILSAAKSGNLDVVKSVLEKSHRFVTAVDEDLYTPLHRAAYNGHLEVMKFLIQCGADTNAPTLDGWTPLHSGCHHSCYNHATNFRAYFDVLFSLLLGESGSG